jgi:hypothetical protein
MPGVFDVELWKRPGETIAPPRGSAGQDLGRVIVTGDSVEEVTARMHTTRQAFHESLVVRSSTG